MLVSIIKRHGNRAPRCIYIFNNKPSFENEWCSNNITRASGLSRCLACYINANAARWRRDYMYMHRIAAIYANIYAVRFGFASVIFSRIATNNKHNWPRRRGAQLYVWKNLHHTHTAAQYSVCFNILNVQRAPRLAARIRRQPTTPPWHSIIAIYIYIYSSLIANRFVYYIVIPRVAVFICVPI